MLELINIEKKYKNKILFQNVNIRIDCPGLYCLVGDNGSGKSTLLNIIGGFIKPTKGKVKKDNKCVLISQKVKLIKTLTIKEHFKMFGLDINLLKKVKLINKENKYPHELSFGMQQRICVLLGLYSGAGIVLCDEPTSHLDKTSSCIIVKLIKDVSKEKIVILVTHNLNLFEGLFNRCYSIVNKEILCNDNNVLLNDVVEKNTKVALKRYFFKYMSKNKRINLLFFIAVFLFSFLFLFVDGVNKGLNSYFDDFDNTIIDYNKFYLKECIDEDKGDVILKRCFNLSDSTIDKLKVDNNFVTINYDVFINDLYSTSNISVVSNFNHIKLVDGRYPLSYNEVIASNDYKIGDIIEVKSSKIIKEKKIDIYKDTIGLKVVGISKKVPFMNNNYLYVDYELIDAFFENTQLVNNDISLKKYFFSKDINDYKYVLYFSKINTELLENNNVEYLSSSYIFCNDLISAFNDVFMILNYVFIFVIVVYIYYLYRLSKKKIKCNMNDILFFKCFSVKERKLTSLISLSDNLMFLISSFILYIFCLFLGNSVLIFKFNYWMILILYAISFIINRKIICRCIRKNITL